MRTYHSDDFEAIEEIYNLSKLDELRFEDKQFRLLPLQLDDKRFRGLMESQIVVFDNGSILGYGAFHGSEISALFVHPSARGKGIGANLLQHLLGLVAEPAKLYVAKSNRPAKSLYTRYGFEITDEFVTSYNDTPVLANEMTRLSV